MPLFIFILQWKRIYYCYKPDNIKIDNIENYFILNLKKKDKKQDHSKTFSIKKHILSIFSKIRNNIKKLYFRLLNYFQIWKVIVIQR